jgi:hypothetical protein
LNPTDEKTCVLILRLWREARQPESAPPVWRGMIEEVATGERVYVKNMGEIVSIIEQQLKKIGQI